MRKQFSSKTIFILIVTVCFALLVAGCARKSNRTTKVTVAGEAITKVEPDVAVLVIAVVTQSAQAIDAQQENARKSEAVGNAVKAIPGANAEIKTSDYTLQPQYDYRDNRLPKIIGYDARNSVTVTISDLKNVGAVIDAASRAGANNIQSVSFMLRQTSPARGAALRDATTQAMNKAQSIAEALGGRVLRVVEENEGTAVSGSPPVYEAMETMKLSATNQTTTPIVSGNLSIRSNVQLIVEIES
jgi:uncharacterized protein